MSVSGIESIGAPSLASWSPYVPPAVSAESTTAARTQGPQGPAFGDLLVDGVQGLEALQDRTEGLRVQAATGDLDALHNYTIAATESGVATQLTVAVRNKAVEAFQEIMRMHVG